MIYRTVIHQQGIARFGYFDARFDEAAFRNTNLKRDKWNSRFSRVLACALEDDPAVFNRVPLESKKIRAERADAKKSTGPEFFEILSE